MQLILQLALSKNARTKKIDIFDELDLEMAKIKMRNSKSDSISKT